MELKGKSAIVTGAGQGIGRGIALSLARHGADVMICDLNLDAAEKTAKEIEALGRKALPFKMDVTNEDDAKKMAQEAEKFFGKIDLLYNNAGTISMCKIEDLEVKAWERIFDVNCKGVFLCSKAVIPYMKKAGGGRIINTASQAGKTGLPLLTHYCATKAAVILFTKGLALELAPHNILVNSICPGSVMTDMTVKESEWASQITGEAPQEILKKWESAIPLQRYAQPDDIANVAVFLASEYSSYMTGQAINVSGGQEMH
ncbi:MAG TPA: SDR family NAD(P)-dependent oxidoreductase [Anaerovoracaceae bacterium]|nr:SDR family NAD(P)-dependent oxidoreductase [Anaerovoracaceae bacterium]